MDCSLIRKLRTEKKMTIAELSQLSQIAPSTISMVENGQRNPSIGTLERLAEALGVEVVVLLEKKNEGD